MIDYSNFAKEQFDISERTIRAYLAELYPTLDTSPGSVINELVIKPAAAAYTFQNIEAQQVKDSFSLLLAATGESVDAESVEQVASNYRVFTRTGKPATGLVAVYVNKNTNLYIYSTSALTAGTMTLVPIKNYVGTSSPGSYTSTDFVEYKELIPAGTNLWYFTMSVKSDSSTSDTLNEGQTLTLAPAQAEVVSIQVVGSVGGGRGDESAQDLANRAAYGVTAAVPSGNAHISSLLENVQDVSILSQVSFGLGDAEMLRDRNNLLGISCGGRVDCYCRTSASPSNSSATLTGLRVEDNRWRVAVSSAIAPGFYYVMEVAHTASGQTLTSPRALDIFFGYESVAGGADVFSGETARYSAYQSAIVEFEMAGITGDSAEFVLTFLLMPSIDELQSYISGSTIRNESQDVLIKAPVPCFVSAHMCFTYPPGLTSASVGALQSIVAGVINGMGIGRDFLSSADIATAVAAQYPELVMRPPVRFEAVTWMPDGTTRYVTTDDGRLDAVSEPEYGVTARNTSFMCSASDLSITLIERSTVV